MHRDLQQLYNQLVLRGVLTEEEFWRGRQSLLKHKLQDSAALKQRRGFDNAMISEVAAGRGSKVPLDTACCCHQLFGSIHKTALCACVSLWQVTLKLTPELKEQIYGERPHIRRAFAALVPQSVSERDFWQKYFNYEVARKVGITQTDLNDTPIRQRMLIAKCVADAWRQARGRARGPL